MFHVHFRETALGDIRQAFALVHYILEVRVAFVGARSKNHRRSTTIFLGGKRCDKIVKVRQPGPALRTLE